MDKDKLYIEDFHALIDSLQYVITDNPHLTPEARASLSALLERLYVMAGIV